MTEQEIKTLAEWAGLTNVEFIGMGCPHKVGVMHFFIPSGDRWGTCIPFPNSLDACFKYLMPKVRDTLDLDEVAFSYCKDSILALITHWRHTGNKEADNYASVIDAKGETEAEALCKAILKLIEGEKE